MSNAATNRNLLGLLVGWGVAATSFAAFAVSYAYRAQSKIRELENKCVGLEDLLLMAIERKSETFHKIFNQIDKDGNGKITKEELLESAERLGVPKDLRESVWERIKPFDNDNDGLISADEFLHYICIAMPRDYTCEELRNFRLRFGLTK